MANASYTSFKQGILDAEFNLLVASIKVALVRGYTYSAAHATMADVVAAGGTINAASAALTTPTITGGVFDADDATITTTANATNHYLIVYQASAVTGGADVAQSAQKLCWYFDTGTNLPIVPGAGTLTITWSNAATKIYKVG